MALTLNTVPRYKGVAGGKAQVQDSAIVDDGSSVAVGLPVTCGALTSSGAVVLAGTITGVTTAITGTKDNALTISVPDQTADKAGKGIAITADAGAVGAKNGGNITLTAGLKSGAGTDGVIALVGAVTASSTLNVTGVITGDLTGNVTGDVTGNVTGDATGALNGILGGVTPAAASITTLAASGHLTMGTATKGLVLKRGANGLCGTFVCNETTPVSVATSAFAITDAVIISLNTVGGTVGAVPAIQTVTAGVGFTVIGTAADTSTYNWALIKNAA